jgi:DNA modification methylase
MYQLMKNKRVKLMQGDNLESLKKLPDNCIDSVVSDPPYGLSFMGKKWDYDVPSVEFWKEVYRVLKPGGHVLSFGGTRTYHRMVVNIEDAGFE